MPEPAKRIAVVGAGISGLTVAFYLQRAGKEVVVFEKNEYAGGCLKSIEKDGFLFEQGALTAVVNHAEVKQLFADCGIEDEVLYADEKSKRRFILRDAKLHEISSNPLKFLFSGLLSFSAKRKIFSELFTRPYIPDENETLGTLVERHFGKEITDYILNPVITGIYASNPYELELSSSFPVIRQAVIEKGSITKGMIAQAKSSKIKGLDRRIFNFKKGQQQLVEALSKPIQINTDVEITRLKRNESGWVIDVNGSEEQFDQVILATPAYVSGKLIEPFDSALGLSLKKIQYNAVTTVQAIAPKNSFTQLPEGFGFLIPEQERGELLGSIFNHVLFPSRFSSDTAAFNLFIGGAMPMDDTSKIDRAKEEFKNITGLKGELTLISAKHWPKGIPLIAQGHSKILKQMEAAESNHPGLYFIGNYRNGISVGDCIKNGKWLADKLAAR